MYRRDTLVGYAKHNRRRAVIDAGCGAKAPVDVVRHGRLIDGSIVLVAIAFTSTASGFAAAVIVGNHVVLPVSRVAACTDPRDW